MLVRIQTERSISVQRVNELAAGKAGFNVTATQQADLDGSADLLQPAPMQSAAVTNGTGLCRVVQYALPAHQALASSGQIFLNAAILDTLRSSHRNSGCSRTQPGQAHDCQVFSQALSSPPPFHASDRHEAFLLASTVHLPCYCNGLPRKSRLTKAPASSRRDKSL